MSLGSDQEGRLQEMGKDVGPANAVGLGTVRTVGLGAGGL